MNSCRQFVGTYEQMTLFALASIHCVLPYSVEFACEKTICKDQKSDNAYDDGHEGISHCESDNDDYDIMTYKISSSLCRANISGLTEQDNRYNQHNNKRYL